MIAEVADINFEESMQIIVNAMFNAMREELHLQMSKLKVCMKNLFLNFQHRCGSFCSWVDVFYFLKYAIFKGMLDFYIWEV